MTGRFEWKSRIEVHLSWRIAEGEENRENIGENNQNENQIKLRREETRGKLEFYEIYL